MENLHSPTLVNKFDSDSTPSTRTKGRFNFTNMENRDFKGVWIPKTIWLNTDLSIVEKCLLVEIDSLDNDPNIGCFASNEYLAKFIGVSEGRCANVISDLKKRGYIKQIFFDGRNRGLRMLINIDKERESSVHENVKADSTQTLKQRSRFREHSNTVNSTVNNTEEKKQSDQLQPPKQTDGTRLEGWLKEIFEDDFIRETFVRSRRIPIEKFDLYWSVFILEANTKKETYFKRADVLNHFLNYSAKRWEIDNRQATKPKQQINGGSSADKFKEKQAF